MLFFLEKKIYIYLCVYIHICTHTNIVFTCVVFVCIMYIHVPSETRKHQMSWNLTFKQSWATWNGCWRLNPSLLQELSELLTNEQSPSPHTFPTLSLFQHILLFNEDLAAALVTSWIFSLAHLLTVSQSQARWFTYVFGCHPSIHRSLWR